MRNRVQLLVEQTCYRVNNLKLSHIVLFFCAALLVVIFYLYCDLSKIEKDGDAEVFEDISSLRASDLKLRIEEMRRIKGSVSTELRDLEFKRQKLQSEILTCIHKIDQYKNEINRQQAELDKLKMSVQQAQVAHHESLIQNTPDLALPLRLLPNRPPLSSLNQPSTSFHSCRYLSDCFDFSRCSFTSGFPVYLYNADLFFSSWYVSSFILSSIKQAIHYNPHFSGDENTACVYLVLIGERSHTSNSSLQLNQLPFWGGDGRNHILINLSRQDLSSDSADLKDLNVGRAMVAQSSWHESFFRPGHDLVIPPALGPSGGDVWFECPYMLPARRKYLMSFLAHSTVSTIYKFDYSVISKYTTSKTSDKFDFNFECDLPTSMIKEEFNLCGNETSRSVILKESTFVLVTPPVNTSLLSTTIFQTRFYEALKYGAIPVVLEFDRVLLPYSEVIDWRKAAIRLPISRITELHFLLRSISDADILLMRRQARMVWEKYFGSVQAIIDSVLAIVRDRINLPALPVKEEPAPSVFSDNFVPLKIDPMVSDAKPEENLGPLEPPYASPKFRRNFTLMLTQGYEVWNEWGDPFKLYPQTPFDPLLPSDAKFIGSGVGFRPVNYGSGGAGKEFSESLGGNLPREQFTIVILSYERDQVLMNSLSRLYGLPYLHRVVVVWNSPRPPLDDLRWPDIGVPVKVVKGKYNSLNNRFLPYEEIETEAVLSVDDDAHLRHDEIIFGFRVWREHRDRVVGFPGRFHALDVNYKPSWLYNSNYSCELSMVLTGAAFVHKTYLYLYSQWLPQAIRDKVDEYMNCEDIAMNFLVSHFTRKPPVKVTSRWTFRCPGCPVSLSEDETHFQERHKCINFFTKVFGYTPLLNTQYRADSILFKTRIPHDKQKCFKFI